MKIILTASKVICGLSCEERQVLSASLISSSHPRRQVGTPQQYLMNSSFMLFCYHPSSATVQAVSSTSFHPNRFQFVPILRVSAKILVDNVTCVISSSEKSNTYIFRPRSQFSSSFLTNIPLLSSHSPILQLLTRFLSLHLHTSHLTLSTPFEHQAALPISRQPYFRDLHNRVYDPQLNEGIRHLKFSLVPFSRCTTAFASQQVLFCRRVVGLPLGHQSNRASDPAASIYEPGVKLGDGCVFCLFW